MLSLKLIHCSCHLILAQAKPIRPKYLWILNPILFIRIQCIACFVKQNTWEDNFIKKKNRILNRNKTFSPQNRLSLEIYKRLFKTRHLADNLVTSVIMGQVKTGC